MQGVQKIYNTRQKKVQIQQKLPQYASNRQYNRTVWEKAKQLSLLECRGLDDAMLFYTTFAALPRSFHG